MKRSFMLLFSVILTFTLSSCRTVMVTSADELVSHSWVGHTENGMVCTIDFEADTVTMTLSSTADEVRTIKGALSVDDSRFYLTSNETFKTYSFSYKVFADRAEITYRSNPVTFYPSDSKKAVTVKTDGGNK